jgi:hypothetical protein
VFRGADGDTIGDTYAPFPTEVSTALDLKFDKVWNPLEASRVEPLGGRMIGRERRTLANGRPLPANSISVLPVGQGSLFAFASAVSGDATVLARDIAQLVATHFVEAEGYRVASANLSLRPGESAEGALEAPVTPATRAVAVTIFSTSDSTPFFASEVVPLAGSPTAGQR